MFKSTTLKILLALILTTTLVSPATISYAQTGDPDITVSGDSTGTCGDISFTFTWEGGTPPFIVSMDFGDGDSTGHVDVDGYSVTIDHMYLDGGDYQWVFHVSEQDLLIGLNGSTSEILTLEGPDVTLNSSPFPPLFVTGDDGLVDFNTTVFDGTIPYSYQWDLDGDGLFDGETGAIASNAYTEVGKYYPQVLVTDGCGFTGSDSIPVVVAESEDICHPMAQKIADGVNTLLPEQILGPYTCEDIYALFENDSEENNLGFGRMWKAYHLAESMEDLSWEDILDWHLNVSGWGTLLQLDRFADLLEEHDLPELMGLVMSEDYTLNDVRTAVRSVTRYEADLEDALTRINEGATPGELTQFYKLALDLEADVKELDGYLADGLSLAELKHTANFAQRMEVDWTEVADARSEADSWGEINQAYHLATDEISAAEILILGVKEYRESLRGETKADQEEQKMEKQEEQTKKTAERLAEQYSAEFGDVLNLLNGECQGEWSCVRSTLRDKAREMSQEFSDKDIQTAQQIAFKYGFTEEEVMQYHKSFCGEDWSCTRAYFREMYMSTRETGKKK